MSVEDKYIATLVGTAVGDTLGMPVEAWKPEHIRKYIGRITKLIAPVIPRGSSGNEVRRDEFGRIGYGFTRIFEKGDYTDDTILTLALAESIADKKCVDLKDVARHHVLAYEKQILPSGEVKGGFGSTTTQAINNLRKGIPLTQSGIIGGPGNAPAMKMAPLGLYMNATGKYDEGLKQAEDIGRITHLDPRSLASGVVQAHAVYSLLKVISRNEFVESIANVCRKNERPLTPELRAQEAGTLTDKIKWVARNQGANAEEVYQHLKCSDLVTESYPFALFMFQKYWDEPIEGLIETVNFGGDADTTGAIYGALCGAKNGMIFPEKWVKEIKNLEPIIRAGKGLYSLKKHR